MELTSCETISRISGVSSLLSSGTGMSGSVNLCNKTPRQVARIKHFKKKLKKMEKKKVWVLHHDDYLEWVAEIGKHEN